MRLTSHTQLGPYEILAPLGAGGMGEVYRARDTRLGREVALKVLPEAFASDPQRMARFEREARVLASLNHPNIAAIHGLEESGSTRALVMELVEGPTLAELLEARDSKVETLDPLRIAQQIAEALEYAHEKGITHRDLKPANVKVTAEGAVKVLDFGLAKAAADTAAPGDPSSSPTLTAATQAGMIMGTAAYMAPEQARGHTVDNRADVWSFGALLFEMLTGQRAFAGETTSDVLASVLKFDPDWNALPASAPPSIARLLRRCLTKDRKQRLQAIGEARITIQECLAGAAGAVPEPEVYPGGRDYGGEGTAHRGVPRRFGVGAVLVGAALLLAGAAISYLLTPRAGAPPLSVRAYMPPPPGTALRTSGLDMGPVVVSPDGRTLAFTAVDKQGVTRLWLRALEAQQATPLAGTEDATYPFWSFDGQDLGFIADGKLEKISVSRGDVQTLAEGLGTETGRGTWNSDGTILFCKERFGAISRVSASGGDVSPAARLEKTELEQIEPSFLPDGKHFLYVSHNNEDEPGEIKVAELGKPEQAGIEIAAGTLPQFASGHLLFVRGGHIEAQRFDPGTLKLSGDPQTLGEAGFFSVSANGVLAYPEGSGESELKVLDRTGNVIATPGPPGNYLTPRFSPDGKSIAVSVVDPKTGTTDIWMYPVAGGQPVRLTFGPNDDFAVWSPDGKEIAYEVDENGRHSIRRRWLDGRRPEETLYTNEAYQFYVPIDWSPDGKYLSMHLSDKMGRYSNWSLPLEGGRRAFRPAATSALTVSEYEGRFSADGHWLCYFAYETGRPEVYVVPFPGAGSQYQVSTTGGWLARFSRDELFYVTLGNRLMSAQIHTHPSFRVDPIRPMFQLDFPNVTSSYPLYDVSPDGQRFAVLTADPTESSSITLVTNWPAELKK